MNRIKFYIGLLSLLCWMACSDDNGKDNGGLSIDKPTLRMKAGEDTQGVLVSGGRFWTVKVLEKDSVWCSVAKLTDQKFVVMTQVNEKVESRHTTVTVSGGISPLEVAVEQLGQIIYELEKDSLNLDYTGKTVRIRFKTNAAWECRSEDSWCHVSADTNGLSVWADELISEESRTGTIRLKVNQIEDYLTVRARQWPDIDPGLKIDGPPNYSMVNGGKVCEYKVTSQLPWNYVFSFSNPAVVSVGEVEIEGDVIRVTFSGNIPRGTIITLTVTSGKSSKTSSVIYM